MNDGQNTALPLLAELEAALTALNDRDIDGVIAILEDMPTPELRTFSTQLADLGRLIKATLRRRSEPPRGRPLSYQPDAERKATASTQIDDGQRGREMVASSERPERLVPTPPRRVLVDDEQTGQLREVAPPKRDSWLGNTGPRTPAVIPARPSMKVAAIREAWQEALREQIQVGEGGWLRLGDCTYDDLIIAAGKCRERARVNGLKAARLTTLADLLQIHGALRVNELPDEILRDRLADAS